MTTYLTGNSFGSIQMMPDEVDYVENCIRNLPEDGVMVEWGSGGSTLHWLEELKATQTLYSIEHDRDWFMRVTSNTGKYHNFRYYYSEVSSVWHNHEYGTVHEENPFNTKTYVCPSSQIYDADLYFIDGIARGACLASVLLNRKKTDSIILMHDYQPRVTAYDWITQFCRVDPVGTTLVKITPV